MSKRKSPRRELSWIEPLLDNLPFSRLPTNSSVLKRIFFLIESGTNGQISIDAAATTVKNELIDLWSYAGHDDILQDHSNILSKIKPMLIDLV